MVFNYKVIKTRFNEIDDVFDPMNGINLSEKARFPFYNLKQDKNNYTLEFAVAGFSKEEIDITVESGILLIVGEKKTKPDQKYIHQGIRSQSFRKTFSLAPNTAVHGADLENGILSIYLEEILPESKKPMKIEIGVPEQPKQQLLSE